VGTTTGEEGRRDPSLLPWLGLGLPFSIGAATVYQVTRRAIGERVTVVFIFLRLVILELASSLGAVHLRPSPCRRSLASSALRLARHFLGRPLLCITCLPPRVEVMPPPPRRAVTRLNSSTVVGNESPPKASTLTRSWGITVTTGANPLSDTATAPPSATRPQLRHQLYLHPLPHPKFDSNSMEYVMGSCCTAVTR
jgi:hypothetical protein